MINDPDYRVCDRAKIDYTALLSVVRPLGSEAREAMARQIEDMTAELESHRNAPVLRMCTMPGCLRQYDMLAAVDSRAPKYPHWSGEGWKTLGSFGHICLEHAAFVEDHHVPRWGVPYTGAPSKTALCSCGWFLEHEAVFTGFQTASWRNHLGLVYRQTVNEEKEKNDGES